MPLITTSTEIHCAGHYVWFHWIYHNETIATNLLSNNGSITEYHKDVKFFSHKVGTLKWTSKSAIVDNEGRVLGIQIRI